MYLNDYFCKLNKYLVIWCLNHPYINRYAANEYSLHSNYISISDATFTMNDPWYTFSHTHQESIVQKILSNIALIIKPDKRTLFFSNLW